MHNRHGLEQGKASLLRHQSAHASHRKNRWRQSKASQHIAAMGFPRKETYIDPVKYATKEHKHRTT